MSKSNEASVEFLTTPPAITSLSISGFKSIVDEQTIEIRPLTLLAGANSSGKSSIMQPLLLMKQTLEASYDPGPLLLDGPNIRFTSVNQMLSRMVRGKCKDSFHVGIEVDAGMTLTVHFDRQPNKGL